jgi:hypothetical protein
VRVTDTPTGRRSVVCSHKFMHWTDRTRRHYARHFNPGAVGVLRLIGRTMTKAKFNYIRSKPGTRSVCIVCQYRWTEVRAVHATVKRKVVKAFNGSPCFPVGYAKTCCRIPLLCGRHRPERYGCSASNLNALHDATKAVLQALPLPIFEEVWNHVGWEELIKT